MASPSDESISRTDSWIDRPVQLWGIVFLLWTALALMSAGQVAIALTNAGSPVDWRMITTDRLLDWYTCGIFTPAYVWLVRRYPVDRQHWRMAVPALILSTALFVVIKYALYSELRPLLIENARPRTLRNLLAQNALVEMIAFWAVVAAVHAAEFYRRVREREMQEAKLRVQLVEARLDALSSQLHPHFLFNTLHGISTLMHRDVDAADTMLAQLSDLLRSTLDSGERREVTVAEEMELLGRYLAIMGVRFGDRLTMEVRVEPGTERALVPHFLLQPLAENALEHGIGKRAGSGRLQITASRVGKRLELRVVDDGTGISRLFDRGDVPLREGVGLSNSRRRLATLYGAEQSLTLTDAAGGGLCVVVSLPFRIAAAADAPAEVARLPRVEPPLQVAGD